MLDSENIEKLSRDERPASGGAALLGIVGRKQPAFFGEAIDVWGAVAHQPLVVSADVPIPDIVSHYKEDIRFVLSEGVHGPK